ncbi:MAG TPA: tRNA (5-methylaminomethyl-2-thiouridine)(34)-methyltransferase MnmD [Caulobacteraceae bacterium]|nr:tRNA (5-methylaminomethyl-2-thiouridine)(34)-methyltransferase MnmD [Caulobacteraceae bacterium]
MSTEPLDWTDDGPRSPRFGDVYFSRSDGLAESRAVFLAGCGLPEAWAGRSRFTVGELGFGTGLNLLALIELWRRTRAPGARLNIFSIEAFPIAAADAQRALAAWPELKALARPLLAAWPDGRRGLHRIDWPEDGVILDLAVAEVEEALAGWDGAADAWFLDGFAPAKNPEMWRPEVVSLVAERSAPGARAATFTVAGAVRRGLEAAGFTVDKRPGFGRKRERLEARRPGAPPRDPSPRVAVVGAGVAGAALVRAFRALGVEPRLFEAKGPGAGASGNPCAMVTPRLDAGLGFGAELHAQAFARAVALYRAEAPAAIIAGGALQLEAGPRDAARFGRLAGWDGFASNGLQPLDLQAASAALGEPTGPALLIRDALTVEPAGVLERWLGGLDWTRTRVAGLERTGAAWRLLDADGAVLGEAETVCLAAGPAVADLTDLPLRVVRGQASWTEAPFAGSAAAWGGYAAPMRRGFLFGATHDRDDAGLDLRPEDHLRNLRTLEQGRPGLAGAVDPAALQGRTGLRAVSHDHMPVAGPVEGQPGLFVLTGLGGRGFTLAPLLAEQVAALALGAPRPLSRALARTVAPDRYGSRRRVRLEEARPPKKDSS